MDRRTALKNLSMSLGYTVAAPTIFNMLASCNAETNTWTPLFLSFNEKHMVIHLADIILPVNDTSGALDMNTPQFLDLMYHDIEKDESKTLFKKGAMLFSEKFTNKFNLEVSQGNKEQFETLLASYFKVSDEDSEILLKEQRLPLEKIQNSKLDNYLIYKFLLSVKRYTLFGYFTSEKVGEGVLNYDPIPGAQIGCMPIEDLPNGKAWSL